MPPWLLQIIIGLVLNVLAFVLLGGVQKPQPPELTDMDDPTSEAGRPRPMVMGSGTVKGINYIGDWDKEPVQRNISADVNKK